MNLDGRWLWDGDTLLINGDEWVLLMGGREKERGSISEWEEKNRERYPGGFEEWIEGTEWEPDETRCVINLLKEYDNTTTE